MIRLDNYFLLTQIDNVLDIKYEGFKFFVEIKVDYCNSTIDFNEKVILPKYIAVLTEDKLDIMILEKVKPIDMESMQLVYTSSEYIKLNEAGKQYYNMLCMTMNKNDTDENWCDIDKFIKEYTY